MIKKVIITFKENSDNSIIESIGGIVHDSLDNISKLLIAEIPEEYIAVLKNNPIIEDVELETFKKPRAVTSGFFDNAIEADNYYMLRLNDYWSRGLTGKGVKVAVLDTGINNHTLIKPLAGGIQAYDSTQRYDRDSSGHGTECAYMLAGTPWYSYGWGATPADNTGRLEGIAPDVSLYSIRCSGDAITDGSTSVAATISGLNWAISNGIQIISCSQGGPTASASEQAAWQAASDAGILLVVSSANAGTADITALNNNYPAKFEAIMTNLVSVMAIDKYFKRSAWASGNYPATGNNTFAALGTFCVMAGISDVTTTGNLAKALHYGNGCSFATPAVAGIFALYKQAFPSLTATQLINKVISCVRDLGTAGKDNVFGYGVPMPHKDIMSMPVLAKSHKGMRFDGNSDYINIPYNPLLNIINNMTIEIKFNQDWKNQGYILEKTNSPRTFHDYGVYSGDDGIGFVAQITAGRTWIGWFNNSLTDGKDHTMAFVISNSNTVTLYMDGVASREPAQTFATPMQSSTLTNVKIGKGITTTGDVNLPFSGTLYSTRIYNRALSSTEIANNYSGNVNRTGLVLEYILNGTETGTVSDLSGNGMTGTINGARPNIKIIL